MLKSEGTPSLKRPTSRAARLSAVEEALLNNIITSQSQLSEILSNEGIDVTQATLSRDLEEIHAVKTRLADGTIAYTIEGQESPVQYADPERVGQQIAKVLSGLVTQVAWANNLVVIHTPSGAAQYVASVIDKQPFESVLGTIAGDDTVMIICAGAQYAVDYGNWLLKLVSHAGEGSK